MSTLATRSDPSILAGAADVSRAFQVLADRTRVRILNLLAAGELCVCDIVELLEQPQPTVSRHLATLREEGIVEVRRRGRYAHYRPGEDAESPHAVLLQCLYELVERTPELVRERRAAERRVAERHDEPCPP